MESPAIATLIKMMETFPEDEQNQAVEAENQGKPFRAAGSQQVMKSSTPPSFSDTPDEISAIQIALLRNASPARKLELVGQMNLTVKTLAMAGLRTGYPDDSPEMLHRRLADLMLGPELALKVYGPYPQEQV